VGFDLTTGLKSVPSENDVMYNDVNARYEIWNGAAWVEITEETLSFSFNYTKYLSTWGITTPDIVPILLGTNDFISTAQTDATFATWKTNMDAVITSIQAAGTAAGKSIKIALCLPCTETVSANNSSSVNPIFQRANMFNARQRMIAAFDNDTYSNGGVDVVDTGSALDGDYGFTISTIKPFLEYAGTETEMYSTNTPHPSNGGYSQLGVRLAAYIQTVR
jgi:lysophospholipase L1-like esterase